MVDTLILDIKQAMSSTLTNGQMEKLHKVLAHYLYDLEITKKEGAEKEEKQNIEYLEAFLSAKHVEGCSRKSLKYYKATIENLFKKIDKSIKHITTNDLREYLDNYQKKGNASKITIDNIRRIFSSFFAWLEEEDYILKSPVRRIHKVKTGTLVKETYSDETMEIMRDNCKSLRDLAIIDNEIDAFTAQAFFSTLTNVNFDSQRIVEYAQQAIAYRDNLMKRCRTLNPSIDINHPLAHLQLEGATISDLTKQAANFALNSDRTLIGEEVHGVRMLCLYGLKGAAAYMEHAHVLGKFDNEVYRQFHEFMAWLGTNPSDLNELLEKALGIGNMNFQVMSLLDAGETEAFGHPVPATVNVKPVAGKCILISGHDLKDLKALLEQTEGTGINIYTHGEMLPAHGYPELKKYNHLVGNYGSGWQNQQKEFAKFPGPVIMTSNCIIDPNVGNYADRIYTRSIVGWPGVMHIEDRDFSQVIAKAQEMAGFPYDELEHKITVGFGRQTLLDA